MREYATPPLTELPASGNLTDDVVRNARETPAAVVVRRRLGGAGAGEGPVGRWEDVTAAAFLAEVTAVAKGLVATGVQPGDRVVLLSRTRYEWTLLDYAIWFAGAVSVPVYESSSAEQLGWVLRDSAATAVLAEGAEHTARIASVRSEREALRHVWCIEDGAVRELTGLGAGIGADELEARRTAATPGDLATLLYTSGTTGRPKGCMLTHGNLLFELGVAVPELHDLFDPDPSAGAADPTTLLFLPLAHVFARIVQLACMRARVTLCHSCDVKDLAADLAEVRPTFVLAVPRVFERLFTTASQRATADGRGALFERGAEIAVAWSRRQDAAVRPGLRRLAGVGPALAVRAQHAAFARVLYPRLREVLGGRCRYAISGGAPLGDRLGHFYRGIGVTVLEGYGLAETTAAVTLNLPDQLKIGTVGRPLPGTSVRVDDDGELLFKGGQVFAGYWNDAAATAQVLDGDGWFRSGDLGEVDDEGFVRVTGRKHEILVTAGGKNVAPAVLEDRVRAHPLVSQCLVVGDGQPFIAALVTLDADAVATWARDRGKSGRVAALVDDPELLAEVQSAVDEANAVVSRAEAIRRFVVLPHDWTEEGGQLTPSLKLKRSIVLREAKDEIAALYLV